MISFFISLLLIVPNCFQTSVERPSARMRIDEVIRQLEVERRKLACEKGGGCAHLDDFLQALQQGVRGDGVRLGWMDKLSRLGIKQVEFNFRFSWHNDGVGFNFEKNAYFRQYYVEGSKADRKLVNQIKEQGVERELREFVVAYLKVRYGKYKPGNVKEGHDNITLFEDEALPVMSWAY